MNGRLPDVTSRDHMTGNLRSAVTLIEYGDYQCPACGQFYQYLKPELARGADAGFRFVFRNFPLGQSHPRATMAARAAEAAALQNRFWQMHDLLYEHQAELGEALIESSCSQLGMDPIRFAEDWLERESVLKRIRDDFMSGVRSGVSVTPGLFLNGIHYTGAWNELPDMIQELAASRRAA